MLHLSFTSGIGLYPRQLSGTASSSADKNCSSFALSKHRKWNEPHGKRGDQMPCDVILRCLKVPPYVLEIHTSAQFY